MKYLLLILCATSLHASVIDNPGRFNVPLLVKYHQEAHAVAGALVGLGVNAGLERWTGLGPIPRFVVSVGTALVIGTAKEYLWDKHPRNKEIGPWGVGAAGALALEYTIRW